MSSEGLDPYELCNTLACRGIKARVESKYTDEDGDIVYEIVITPPQSLEHIELNFDLYFE